MEKREQRARRDRRRDGKRNTFQNDQRKETVEQQGSPVEKKRNDAQNNEVSNKKSTSEDKDKTIEDDPLRFANLKRETDEIAALKARKPQKRQVFSNWSKYEEPLPIQDESRAVDFESLLHTPQSGGFRFKSEQQWDTGSYGRFGELFTPDAELLVGGLISLPLYERLAIDKTLFTEDEIERMNSSAKANYVAYEKLSKSKPKLKVATTDLFKIDQAEKYNVVDQANGPTVDLGMSTNKPVFSVEASPEAPPADVSLPTHTACSNVEQSGPGSESTSTTEFSHERTARDFHFGKPLPPPSHGVAENFHSQIPSRERMPVRDGYRGTASPELHFERAPQPLYTSGNLKSPFHSRESTPAKETAPTTVSRDSVGSLAPISHSSSNEQATGREGTPDPAALTIRERETVQKMRNDRPTSTGFTSTAGERQSREEEVASREASLIQKAVDALPRVVASSSPEVKHPLNKIPSKVETCGKEEITTEPVLQRNSVDVREEATHQKCPHGSTTASEQQLCESCTVNDSSLKKRGKLDVKNIDGQQRGGGRHGRRKKGQNASAQGEEHLRVEARDVCHNIIKLEAEGAVQTAAKADTRADTGHEEVHPADGSKKKPQRPPPPAVPQRELSPPQAPVPSSTPTAVRQTEKVRQPLASQPEEPKAAQVSVSATPPDGQAQPSRKKTAPIAKPELVPKERSPVDDDGLNFLMSLRGQKVGGVSEVEAAKSAAGATASRSAIEEDELKESQKPKPPPVIATEKKEDLEDWLDSMLDD